MVCDQIFHGQTDFLCAFEESESGGIILRGINPGSDQCDFLVADIEMVVDGTFAAVHEEADFAHTAAATDHFPGILCSCRHAGTLDQEFCAETIGNALDVCQLIFKGSIFGEVEGIFHAQTLCKFQTAVVAVHSDDRFNTQCTQHGNDHQTDGTAALHQHGSIEAEQTGKFCAFHGMNSHGCGFHQHSLIQRHAVDLEESGAFFDEQVFAEIAVEMDIVIRIQTVDAGFFAHIRSGGRVAAGITFTAGNDAGDDLIADTHGQTGEIGLDIFTDLDDGTGSFVTKHGGADAEGIAFVFVTIGAADAAAFHLDQHFIVADFRNGITFQFKFTGFHEDRHFCSFRHCECFFFSHDRSP